MISRAHLFAAALAGILVCSAAGAQTRDAAPPAQPKPSAAPVPAPVPAAAPLRPLRATNPAPAPPSARAPQHAQTSGESQGFRVGRGSQEFSHSGSGRTTSFDGEDGVPGLGFDFPHLAALRKAREGSIPSQPEHHEHQGQGQGQGFFVAIPFGGYPYYVDPTTIEPIDQQATDPQQYDQQAAQPQPENQPQYPSQYQTQYPAQGQGQNLTARPAEAPPSGEAGAAQRPSNIERAPHPEEPVRDIGNFILVRRDGRIIFASLFSVIGTQLRYLTPDGIRHTMPLSDIDADATQQMNEARGTTVKLAN